MSKIFDFIKKRFAPVNQSAYEGAGQGRRAASWYAPGSGPNATLSSNLNTLRNRSRAGYRNNPWIAKGINSLVTNEIGTGIIPRSTASDEDHRKAVNTLWDQSAGEFDTEGNLDFYGFQAQMVRARRTAGEVFIRRRVRRFGDFAVPVQIQVLESEFVPMEKTEARPNGNAIQNGIEFNKRGRRVAYWMYSQHPADQQAGATNKLLRIPARDVIHHYLPTRPGQVRGEPDSIRALLKAHTFDSYDDAELVRKQTRSPFTGFLYREEYDEDDYQFDPISGDPISTDSDGVPTLDSQPGTILNGLPGEKLQLFDGDDTGQGYADFMRQQLLGIAASYDLPYELLTGDWKNVNDRLVRAILNEFHRQIEMAQDHLTTFQICHGVWRWWMDSAVVSGALDAPDYADRWRDYRSVEWRPQAWPYVHPEQDVNAKTKSIDAGLTSRDAEVAKSGWDADEIDRQNVEGEKRLRKMRVDAGLPEYPPPKNQQTVSKPDPA
ncbi:MAG: phage portal protein [Candidatus Sedimenticola sp. (ex Thyasira tokunagai)]